MTHWWHTEIITNTHTHIHSPGLRFSLEQALSPPLWVGTEVIRQLSTNLLHRSERVALLFTTNTKYQLNPKRKSYFCLCLYQICQDAWNKGHADSIISVSAGVWNLTLVSLSVSNKKTTCYAGDKLELLLHPTPTIQHKRPLHLCSWQKT